MSHFLLFVLVERDPTAKHWRATPVHEHRRRLHELMARHFAREPANKPGCTCDGYVVGGWYDGVLHGKPQEHGLTVEGVRRRFGVAFEKVSFEDNIRPVDEIPEGVCPFAVVRPDGSWLDVEEHGAPAIREALTSHADCLAIAVDCHR